MVGFIIANVLAVLLIFVYSLMRIASDADERAEQIFQKYNQEKKVTQSTP